MDESIDDCITRRRRECTEPIWHTVPYLCGNEKVCLKKFEQTIQITKQRIDSKYLVIGVLEQLKVHFILDELDRPSLGLPGPSHDIRSVLWTPDPDL